MARFCAAAALIAFVAAGLFAPYKWWGEVAEVLVNFFALFAAGLVQALAVNAVLLRPEVLELEQLDRLSRPLERVQHRWVGTFGCVVLCVAALCAAKLGINWNNPMSLPAPKYVDLVVDRLGVDMLASGITAALIAFTVSHGASFLAGFIELHKLNVSLAREAIRRRNVDKLREAAERRPQYSNPDPEFGALLPH